MVTIELKNIKKSFGSVEAVKDIEISVDDGEFLSLVGPSGCGKTTTLRLIAGLEYPDQGTIHFGENNVTELPGSQRNVGFVFQNLALYPHMSVHENIEFGMKMRNITENDRDRRISDITEMLEIYELLERKPADLSGGQQQRVAIARTLVLEPDVFLLDEPLSSLDAKLQLSVREELQKIQQDLGITTIYVTHNQAQAMAIGDRVVIMNEGEIEQIDTPKNIYNDPVNIMVADFVGTPPMNLINSSIKQINNRPVIDIKFTNLTIEDIPNNLVGDNVIFGIRPEDIYIQNSDESSNESFTGELEFFEPMGSHYVYHFSVDNQSLTVLDDPEVVSEIGGEYELTIDVPKSHLFSSESFEKLPIN